MYVFADYMQIEFYRSNQNQHSFLKLHVYTVYIHCTFMHIK